MNFTNDDPVAHNTTSLLTLFNLTIENEVILPNNSTYQLSLYNLEGVYSFEEKEVLQLLDDIRVTDNHTYHLGHIILDSSENKYIVTDGLQRLITLCMLIEELQHNIPSSLLTEIIESIEDQKCIAFNRYLIKKYIANYPPGAFKLNNLLQNIQFRVVTVQVNIPDHIGNIFAHMSERNQPVSDSDLLKMQHLKYKQMP